MMLIQPFAALPWGTIWTSLGSFAAFLAALATFYTVREMKKQREASYYPEIGLAKIRVEGEATDENICSRWKIVSKSTLEKPLYHIPLYNIGLGVAKNVNVVFSFDIQFLVNKINQLALENDIPTNIEFKKNLLRFRGLLDQVVIINSEMKDSFNFVFPTLSSGELVTIRLPYSYTELVSIYMFIFYKSFKNTAHRDFTVPPLKIVFDYLDISNRNHSTKFTVEFDLIVYHKDGFEAYLDPKIEFKK